MILFLHKEMVINIVYLTYVSKEKVQCSVPTDHRLMESVENNYELLESNNVL